MGVELDQKAPDFELPDQDGNKVRLSDFRGKQNVILAFYPADFTPVCTKDAPCAHSVAGECRFHTRGRKWCTS